MKFVKSIFQGLYPYGIFRVGKEPFDHNPQGCTADRNNVVYLTFDDGPIPEVTPKVLDILAKYDVKATFFMVGENIDKHPDVFQQVVKAGHSVGNHTYNHLKGWYCSFEDYMANVQKCQKTIENRLSTLNLFRPPYGKATFRQRRALAKQGYRIIYWDILTQDYNPARSPEYMFAKIRKQVRPGSIINFHDSLKSNQRMLEVLPQAIEWLQQQGYALKAL